MTLLTGVLAVGLLGYPVPSNLLTPPLVELEGSFKGGLGARGPSLLAAVYLVTYWVGFRSGETAMVRRPLFEGAQVG